MFRSFSQGTSEPAPAAAVEAIAQAEHSAPSSGETLDTTDTTVASVEASTAAQAESRPSAASPETAEDKPDASVEATTFAHGMSHQENAEEASAVAVTENIAGTDDKTAAEQSNLGNGPGGEEEMGKETKDKGSKSGWHQIRQGAPATVNPLEAAKESEEAPKTMAASASAEGGTDASHIASIVDSVLADLRPKIVEEIAKQLAKK
jgi:hypothetical protein